MDLDDTVSKTTDSIYTDSVPIPEVVDKIREYAADGFEIVFHSSRNMRTFAGNLGKINIHTLPIVIDWLRRHDIPFDEIYMGKPWCGTDGFYVDDKAIRPDEFVNLTYEQIRVLTKGE
ncbi:HAD family hydrolase [Arthrobacter sp. Sr24]